jgi:hypothetical protein
MRLEWSAYALADRTAFFAKRAIPRFSWPFGSPATPVPS